MITDEEFSKRRRLLISQMGEESVAVIVAAKMCMRSKDTEYRYRQDSNFYYLTGFSEPESIALFIPGRKEGEYVLFCRPKDRQQEIWHGVRTGLQGACQQYGADQAFAIDEFDKQLEKFLHNKKRIYFPFKSDAGHLLNMLQKMCQTARRFDHFPDEIINIESIVDEMRLYKSEAEIDLMRKAAQISVAGHQRAMQMCEQGQYEYQIESELLREFHRQGCAAPAYSSIVAGGDNACILHYTQNHAELKQNDLLLIDAGGEYQCYTADITRTFPVSGRFSAEQRAIYEIVLRAQSTAIEKVRPDTPWPDLEETVRWIITEGLVELGLLKGSIVQLIEEKAYFQFYMHSSGHWLGMDVHDVGRYQHQGQWRLLQSGMVFTVEPGIYIAPDCDQVEERWRGIGIRIEDDILVTKDSYENLSAGLVKTVSDIEAFMNE